VLAISRLPEVAGSTSLESHPSRIERQAEPRRILIAQGNQFDSDFEHLTGHCRVCRDPDVA